MPANEIHVVFGSQIPLGMGEPPVPLARPAVLKALFAATSRRVRSLPRLSQSHQKA
jgi:isoquinoline 1-oxidoreductase beta subunit